MKPCVLASGLCWLTEPRQMGLSWQLKRTDEGELLLVIVTHDGVLAQYPVYQEIGGTQTTIGALMATLLAVAA